MPRSWRIVKAKYAGAAFDGEGARASGGRWNSPGTRIVYTAESRSLATLELLVHLNNSVILGSYVLISANFQETDVESLDESSLPSNWRAYPSPGELQRIGDDWIRELRSVVLRVPSVLMEGESNYLLNPEHPAFASTIEISEPKSFDLDLRLLKNRPV